MKRYLFVAACALVGLATVPAHANLQTFDLTWSGAGLGNSAIGVGSITFDPSLLSSTTQNILSPGTDVTAFTLTVTGAATGNGTFNLPVFADFVLDTNGAALDFTKELIGQPTTGNPFGDILDGNSGNFNIFVNGVDPANTPGAISFFTISTSGGGGTELELISFRPADISAAAPEPGTLALLAASGLGMGLGLVRRRIRK